MPEHPPCYICQRPVFLNTQSANGADANDVICYHCGQYSITGIAQSMMGKYRDSPEKIARIGYWIQERPKVVINSTMVRNDEIVADPLNPSERADQLFLHICDVIPELGQGLSRSELFKEINNYLNDRLTDRDDLPDDTRTRIKYFREIGIPFLSKSMSKSQGELNTLLDDFLVMQKGYLIDDNGTLKITPAGWEFYHRYAKENEHRNTAFIAMSFAGYLIAQLLPLIKEAVNEAGYEPLCMNDHQHNEIIDFEMLDQIKKSRFVIADLTTGNNGAYFEAGFGEGLGKPVIYTAKSHCLNDNTDDPLHFDTEHRLITKWELDENGEELHNFKNNLKERILITIGPGPAYSA